MTSLLSIFPIAQMASFQIFFISAFFFVLNSASSAKICKKTYCDDLNRFPLVKFPFQLNTTSQNKRCGHPGFNLSCNNRSQTILTLPHSGDFAVQDISYLEQSMYIEDPDGCFPRRFLTQNFTLSGSPFQLSETSKNYTFYNCSKEKSYEYAAPVSCLSGDNFTVLVTFNPESDLQQQCQEIMYAPINKVELSWFEPGCGVCVQGSQECALISDDSLEVGCFDVATATPSNGMLRSVKYGLAIGVGIPGLLCFIGLACCLCNRVWLNSQRPNTQLSTSTVPQQAAFVMGLDGRIIESYPKTFLGESRELPNPNDNTCSICLSEYQPKEILRTIPECNHYFHANCIDEWLKINATCPICRNSPN